MLDQKILDNIRAAINSNGIQKVAFSPLTPEAQAAAQQGAQGGMPPGAPMDPAAGGMPMMPPGAPMDPNAAAGMAPPMDPNAGAAPMDPAAQGMPMDPSMMGGQPAADPNAMPPAAPGAQPAATPVVVTLEDLQAMFMQKDSDSAASTAEIKKAIDGLGEQLQALTQMLGVSMPPSQVGAGAEPGIPMPAEPPALDEMAQSMAPKTAAVKVQRHGALLATVQRLKKYG